MHPYKTLPPHCFWKANVAAPAPAEVDPVVRAKFKIKPEDKVATAGSCFAQHIARHLAKAGFNYFVTESLHPLINFPTVEEFNYGTYSARYGNLYTARQLLQLLQRVGGLRDPIEDVWQERDCIIDPFRPQIQPGGFSSMKEYETDRIQHFAAVERMVKELDVFVFTLGLTEAWQSKEDGSVFPLCPGVAGGIFDPDRYEFINFGVSEIVADMKAAFALIRERNPNARFLVTVSPVPLIATCEDRSALVSTTYSKSVLRVACEELSRDESVAYFPSYEVITGSFNRGAYFASDLRSVNEAGVGHVMRLFMKHYADRDAAAPIQPIAPASSVVDQLTEAVAVICDEEALAR